jgi:glycosyltransferase involved in cell wall biosynthesis
MRSLRDLYLSVVIPTCNRRNILQDCLSALEAQTLPSDCFEVLVIDDGSIDDTWDFLQHINTPFPLHIFRQTSRQGPARARNVGIRAARGDVILFLNDDAILESNALYTHLSTHLHLSEYRLSVLGRFELSPHFQKNLWGFILAHSDLIFDYISLDQNKVLDWNHYYTCNISTPKQALLEAGMFDEDFTGELWGAEDIELGFRLAQLKPPVYIIFREGCAAEHRHDVTVKDFARMFRVRGGGAVTMFVRHRDMPVHYRPIQKQDVEFWINLPSSIQHKVQILHELLEVTEEIPLNFIENNKRNTLFFFEKDFPIIYDLGRALWRMREDHILWILDERIREVRDALMWVRKREKNLQRVAENIYSACLYLRWHHDTEGVCSSALISKMWNNS